MFQPHTLASISGFYIPLFLHTPLTRVEYKFCLYLAPCGVTSEVMAGPVWRVLAALWHEHRSTVATGALPAFSFSTACL